MKRRKKKVGVWSDPIVIPGMIPGSPDIIIRTACIRLGDNNVNGRPYYHFNSTHAKLGIAQWGNDEWVKLDSESGNMIIEGVSAGSGEQVGALIPHIDESMAKNRILSGVSGDARTGKVILTSGTNTVISPRSTLFNDNLHNIWFTSIAYRQPTIEDDEREGGMLNWINIQDLSNNVTMEDVLNRLDALES
jgi:hypothetical protein